MVDIEIKENFNKNYELVIHYEDSKTEAISYLKCIKGKINNRVDKTSLYFQNLAQAYRDAV